MAYPLSPSLWFSRDNNGESMIDWTTCKAVERDPARISGAWAFQGTRVPVSALFSNLEGGATIDEFLEWFPGVRRGQVIEILEHASRSLLDPVAA